MSDKQQPLPSLAPERDQVEAYKTSRPETKPRGKAPSSGNSSLFLNVMIYVLLILIMGGAWWFDLQNKNLQAKLDIADSRIQKLEEQLSATGEEMGESAVVIKARIKSLSERTDELWVQMDKLWASAWRRNQADIKKLSEQTDKQQKSISDIKKRETTTLSSIKSIKDKQTQADFNLGIMTEQMESAKNVQADIDKLKEEVTSIQSKAFTGDQNQIELASTVSRLEKEIADLQRRLNQLQGTP